MRNPDQTRQKILQAAFQEIHRNGFQASSLNPILARTGVTKGALYHHFPSKHALGYAVVEELIQEMVSETWVRPLENSEDPIDCLKGMILSAGGSMEKEDVLLGCPLNNLCLEMSPIDEGFRLRVNKVYELWREGIARAFRSGQARGTVSESIDPLDAATFAVASLAGCRSLAKNVQSRVMLVKCGENLIRYLETLRA